MWCVDKTNDMYVLDVGNLVRSLPLSPNPLKLTTNPTQPTQPSQPSEEYLDQWRTKFAASAQEKFAAFNPPVKVEDPFVEGPEADLVLDSSLQPCDWKNPKFHRDLAKTLVDLFKRTPVIDFNFIRNNLPLEDKSNTPPQVR